MDQMVVSEEVNQEVVPIETTRQGPGRPVEFEENKRFAHVWNKASSRRQVASRLHPGKTITPRELIDVSARASYLRRRYAELKIKAFPKGRHALA